MGGLEIKALQSMKWSWPCNSVAQYNIRSLMSLVAVAALLVSGVVLLLRYSVATRPALPSQSRSGVITEGVDINWRPKTERHSLPGDPLPSEFARRRQF